MPQVLRRSPTILATILLPATVAVLVSGCATFSDSDAVARVDDVSLTSDEFDARLLELGVTADDVVLLEPVRAEIGNWINQQLAAGVDVAAIYDEGPATSGVVCIKAIVVADEATAGGVLADLDGGTPFADAFTENNLDQSLAATGGAVQCLGPQDIELNTTQPFVVAAAGLTPDEPAATAPLFDQTGAEVGWVVLAFRPSDELEADEVDQLAGLVDLTDAAADADVYVDPRFGTFDPETGTVVGLG